MKSNRNLFINGIQSGGMVFPKAGTILTPEQAIEIENGLQRRFQGVDHCAPMGVFRTELDMKALACRHGMLNLRPATFGAGGYCRSYAVPLDLIGATNL